MCGIVGVFSANGLPQNVIDEPTFEQMLAHLHHRGPDERSYLTNSHAWLGHARLSIIDIASGQQPMSCENGQVYITFNGEIFNYLELREMLQKKGEYFRTKSDTEVLLALYKTHGEDMFEYINGQYAFCIWDRQANRVLLARDHAGILPLFYTMQGGVLYFASSIKALLQHPNIQSRLNLRALKSQCTFWVPISDLTFFEGIHQVQPGEYLTLSAGGLEKGRHWDLNFPESDTKRSISLWKDDVASALDAAVKVRLRADVPVGSYLSGGLDSSILTMLADKQQGHSLSTFSVRFMEKDYDETVYQHLLEEQCGSHHHSVMLSSADMANSYETMVCHAEQPVYRTAPIPLYHLSRTVSDNNLKVVITGEGADEIAWGYNIFKETAIRARIAGGADDNVWQQELASLYPYLRQFDARYSKLMMSFYRANSSDADHPLFSHAIRMKNGQSALQFMTDDAQRETAEYDVEQDLIDTLPRDFSAFSPLQKTQYLEMKTLLAGYLLSSQGDRMSMAHSVETRFPFLDKNVMTLFAAMPDELKLRGAVEKHILKEAFRSELPAEITNRPKQPYRAPESPVILSDHLKKTYLSEEALNMSGLFNQIRVKKLVDKLEAANKSDKFSFNDNFALNFVMSMQVFYYHFIQNIPISAPLRGPINKIHVV